MAAAVQKALYLKQLLEDFGIQQKHPIAIGENYHSCQTLPKPSHSKRSKHIETKFHFIRDKTKDETISIPGSYLQTGSKYLEEIFTPVKGANIQNSFEGSRFYAICSGLSGGVGNSNRTIVLNLEISESCT